MVAAVVTMAPVVTEVAGTAVADVLGLAAALSAEAAVAEVHSTSLR